MIRIFYDAETGVIKMVSYGGVGVDIAGLASIDVLPATAIDMQNMIVVGGALVPAP